MLVDCLIFFAACQAAYTQSNGITLPITSLYYKSLPTNPKEKSLSFKNKENIETTSDVKLIEQQVSSPRMTSRYVYPGNFNPRPIVPISMLPQSQILQTNCPRQTEKSISEQNLGFNTATTPQVTTLPVINLPNKVENNTMWDKISLNGAPQNVINNSNNTVNLKYCVPAIANTSPYSSYKINKVNTPAVYIDSNKQKYFRPEVPDFDDKFIQEIHLIPERDGKQNQIKNGISSKISEGTFDPLSNNSVQQQNIDYPRILKVQNIEKAPVATLKTYFYVPRKLPKVYQLPNVYTDTKTTPYYSSNISPTVCQESNTYNCVKREKIADSPTVQPLENSSYDPENIMVKTSTGIDAINCIPSILKYYSAPTHLSDTPTISQLPNVCAFPKVTCPDAPQRTETYPSNVIYINMADMSSPKSKDNRVPICNLDTEAKLKRPIQPVAGPSTFPLYTPLNSKYMKPLNYIPAPNVIHYQPEYTNFAITPSLESPYLCPSSSILFPTSSDLFGSSISDSLNNIISSLTTGLLSAFHDIVSPEENVLSMLSDSEFITNSLTDAPSYKYSETSITLSMPVFLLSPPPLESPSCLPVPNVHLPLKESENKLSSKKKPKPYISTITINLLPTREETNDIIIML